MPKDNYTPEYTPIVVRTRWSARQIDEHRFEILVPKTPCGVPVLTPTFITEFKLSDNEIDTAETAALRAIAIVSP